MEKVLLWYETNMKELNKKDLFAFLSRKSLKNDVSKHVFYHTTLYKDVYDFILKHLRETTCIQVYQDGVIRLHLKHEHFDTPKSVFFEEDENYEATITMIKELITFSRNN